MIYWSGFLLYSVTVIAIGIRVWMRDRRRQHQLNNDTYWSADRSLPGWATGLSISASMMSVSWSCVYGVQLFYWYGIGAMWLLIIPWLVTMAGFYVFAPRFRRMNTFSQPELLEKRFGRSARTLLAPALIVVFIAWTGAEIYAAGNIIAPFLGIEPKTALLLISLVVAAYSFTGGFAAVVSTDRIQFALVALFVTIMALTAAQNNEGALLSTSVTPPMAVSGPRWFTPGLTLILITAMAYLPGWLIETDVWLRLQASASDSEARKAVGIASVNSLVFVGIMPAIIGIAALNIYPPVDGVVPERIQDGALILTALMQDFLPLGLSVLLSVGLMSAAMSTVDTCGNVVALSLSYDLLEPCLNQKLSPVQLNRLARWMSVVAIFISYLYALFTDSLWDIFYLSSGILTTTVFVPVLASFHHSATAAKVKAAMSSGFIATLVFYYIESRGKLPALFTDTGLTYIVYGLAVSLLAYFAWPAKPRGVAHAE